MKPRDNWNTIIHDIGMLLVGIAAIIALCQTRGVLEEIFKIQQQAESIMTIVKRLETSSIADASKVDGKININKLKANIAAYNQSNTQFQIDDIAGLMVELDNNTLSQEVQLMGLSNRLVSRAKKKVD